MLKLGGRCEAVYLSWCFCESICSTFIDFSTLSHLLFAHLDSPPDQKKTTFTRFLRLTELRVNRFHFSHSFETPVENLLLLHRYFCFLSNYARCCCCCCCCRWIIFRYFLFIGNLFTDSLNTRKKCSALDDVAHYREKNERIWVKEVNAAMLFKKP